MPRAQGARSLLAGVFESTYGTTPGTGFYTLPFVRNRLRGTAPLLDEDVLGQGRDPLAPGLDVEDVAGDIEVPIDAEAIGFWLKGLLGAPTTTGTDPYTHVFSSGGWSLPSMSLEVGMPEVPHFPMFAGVKIDQMSFSQGRSGWAAATMRLVGQKETKATSTQAGTPTEYDYTRFAQRHGAVTRAGSALGDVMSAEITYMNNLDRIETVGNSGLIAGADPSMASLQVRLRMRYSSTTLFDQAVANTAAAFTFAYSAGGNSLTFAVPKLFLSKPQRPIEGPRGIEATFEGSASQDAGGDPMLTATLVNGVASY